MQSLMSGSPDTREQAVDGIGELIDVTSKNSLEPFVVPITGYSIHMTFELSLFDLANPGGY